MPDIYNHFDGRKDVIKFVDIYGSMILEAERKEAKGEPNREPSKAKTKRKK